MSVLNKSLLFRILVIVASEYNYKQSNFIKYMRDYSYLRTLSMSNSSYNNQIKFFRIFNSKWNVV